MAKKGDGNAPTIVRKIEIVEGGGHHGGAWKVAYADFVTAMMAFFLLMWLLNATTEQQRRGIADYFSPANVFSPSTSGSGKPFGGKTPNDTDAMVSNSGSVQVVNGQRPPEPDQQEEEDTQLAAPRPAEQQDGNTAPTPRAGAQAAGVAAQGAGTQPGGRSSPENAGFASRRVDRPDGAVATTTATGPTPPGKLTDAAFQAEQARREHDAFEKAAQEIRTAINSDPALAELSHQIKLDMTPEGLRIQLIDEDKRPMFPSGSASLADRAQQLLQKVGPILAKMSEQIAITGHTDSAPFSAPNSAGGRSNWELSADRANATRRLLLETGLPEQRIRSVTGMADRDPLLPDDPTNASNRRISIVVLRNAAAQAPAPGAGAADAAPGATGGGAPAAVAPAVPAPATLAVPVGPPSGPDAAHAAVPVKP
jgi:chemotaxis protein MotB